MDTIMLMVENIWVLMFFHKSREPLSSRKLFTAVHSDATERSASLRARVRFAVSASSILHKDVGLQSRAAKKLTTCVGKYEFGKGTSSRALEKVTSSEI